MLKNKKNTVDPADPIVNLNLQDLVNEANAILTPYYNQTAAKPKKPDSYKHPRMWATAFVVSDMAGSACNVLGVPFRAIRKRYRDEMRHIAQVNAKAALMTCPDCSPKIRTDFAATKISDACPQHQDAYRLSY